MKFFGMNIKPQTIQEWLKDRKDFSRVKVVEAIDRGVERDFRIVALHDLGANEVYIVHSEEMEKER